MSTTSSRASAIVMHDGHTAAQLREHVFAGDLVLLPPTHASLEMAAWARELLESHFAPHHPLDAQHALSVEDFAAVLGKAKHDFTNHATSWDLMVATLASHGFGDVEEYYADVPRVRISTSDDFLTSGAGHQQPPHRDTWWASPFAQLNFWGPIFPMHPDAGIDFFPGLFSTPLPNTSSIFDLDDWQTRGRPAAARETGRKDTRGIPEPTAVVADVAVTPVLPVGGLVLFSGAQAHATKPHRTGRSRGSVDFRIVSLTDVAEGNGPPNIDSDCTGSAIRDFRHCVTREQVPADLQARVATVPPMR